MDSRVDRRMRIGRQLLGVRLREVRVARDLTVLDLAQAAGVHKSYVSKVEHGERLPTLEVLDAFACALGVPVTGLLDGLFPWDTDEEPTDVEPAVDARRRVDPTTRPGN